ncbi:MAG: sulfatase [Rhodothermales bacterium]|nr:sulfatase [Rhodothermales bacterium]
MRNSLQGLLVLLTCSMLGFVLPGASPGSVSTRAPRNVVFILSDDHRHDFMGFHPNAPDFLETPNLDRMAAGGMHVRNAFVTTALCSPSRASILTGQYSYRHGVVDNNRALAEGTRFFPQDLQQAGYETAFFGKWHMGGESDDPRPGFDHWVSFRGQGEYFNPTLNVNGERAPVEGYTADILTDQALAWLGDRQGEAPFFLYLSHKSVHAEFEPAPRHRGRYDDATLRYPPTMANTEENYRGKPHWVRAQRYGWHGVEHMYHGTMDFDTFYRRYCETLLGLDDSVGRVLDHLEASGELENTLVVYMGDNGFSFGEHGLIDKRHAYEESMRVPMLAYAPGFIPAGTAIDQMVLNIDVAPTILELAGLRTPDRMQGRSFLPLLQGGDAADWRTEFVYQYFWEYNFPHTPTVYALRGDRYKYMYYHGVWDQNELYDLQTDPSEAFNLIDSPQHQELADVMKDRLFDALEAEDAVDVAFRRPQYGQQDQRKLHD